MLRRTPRTLLAVTLSGALWLPVAAAATPAPGGGAGRLPRSVPSPIGASIELLRGLWAAVSSSPNALAAAAQNEERPVTIEEGAGLDPHGRPK